MAGKKTASKSADWEARGRVKTTDADRAMMEAVRVGGGGGGGRRGPAGRVFHVNLTTATKARQNGQGADPDYLARLGTYADRNEDLIATGGRSVEEMKDILAAVDWQTRRKNGKIAYGMVMELPAERAGSSRRGGRGGVKPPLYER
jgi:hypothetical protein